MRKTDWCNFWNMRSRGSYLVTGWGAAWHGISHSPRVAFCLDIGNWKFLWFCNFLDLVRFHESLSRIRLRMLGVCFPNVLLNAFELNGGLILISSFFGSNKTIMIFSRYFWCDTSVCAIWFFFLLFFIPEINEIL